MLGSPECAALVDYRYTGTRATGADIAIARDLAALDEYDPHLDLTPLPPAEGVNGPRGEPGADR